MTTLAPQVGIAAACRVLGVTRSTYYRVQQPVVARPPRRPSRRALTPEEQAQVRIVLSSERFADCAPRQIYATL